MKTSTLTSVVSFTIGFFIPSNASAQGFIQKLTEGISITFPVECKKREVGESTTFYSLRLADSTTNFSALVDNLEKSNGLDAATLALASQEEKMWDEAAQALLKQMGEGAVQKRPRNEKH